MAKTYICKCGRVVQKSTNADNSGNRATDGCEGCPYLLPWGPMVWDEHQKAYTQDVKGQECRMSPVIEYTTTYHGRADDKCSLHIVSLDLDFLDEVQAWIYDHANETLRAGFSRGSMRGIEFSNKGRYSLSVLCAQNKRGIAAKESLLAEFFGPDKHRLDMTPEQEKAHILAAIEAGKARAQRKENTMVYKDPSTGWLYRVSPKPDEKSCFFIEYLDPESSVVWKRDHKAAQGHPYVTSVQSRLSYLAKEKGWVPMEEKEWNKPKDAPSGAVAVTTDGSAAATCEGPDAETRTTPADASGAQLPQPLAQSAPRQTEHATDTAPAAPSAPVFDYSGLDKKTAATLQAAERLIFEARRDYVTGLANAVHIAHEALCGGVVQNLDNSKHGNRGDDAFASWCASVGLKRSTAYNLLQVNALLSGATAEEQATLEAASPSLLYAAAKPSAPAELVQAVKDGDITTHKQYQEALAEIRAKDAKIQELMEVSKDAARRADEARAWAKKAEQEAALDRKEREDAHEKAMHYKAECDRRAQEQQRVEGLRSTREEQLRQAQQEAQNAARTIQRKQEAIEELDEIARERLEQIEALEKGRTIEAQVSDPEEVRRQAEALARELAAAETEKLQSENRTLRSCAPAIQQAKMVLVAVMAQVLRECDKLEADDEEGSDALIEVSGELLSWSADIKERVMAAAGYEEDGYDTDEN
ncbi:hypothetical protein [Candidatus Allofournierella excrementavium]|uniref:hypothetical protein n=1 Tax=Candidatus Allofournierella excrementavium TaxID=2838591 RepID=UPI003AB334F9